MCGISGFDLLLAGLMLGVVIFAVVYLMELL
jgi:hypothetical protein